MAGLGFLRPHPPGLPSHFRRGERAGGKDAGMAGAGGDKAGGDEEDGHTSPLMTARRPSSRCERHAQIERGTIDDALARQCRLRAVKIMIRTAHIAHLRREKPIRQCRGLRLCLRLIAAETADPATGARR